MRKIILTTVGLVLALAALLMLRKRHSCVQTKYLVGILQTAAHPALDATCQGFISELQQQFGKSVSFVIQNAQGSISTAHAMAQQLQSNQQIDAFFAIATPAAQALGAVEKKRPIVIAAVTDPHSLGLIYPNTNICGVSDRIDVDAEVDLLTKLVPNAQHVGLLYTNGEPNSLSLAHAMRQSLAKKQLSVTNFTMTSESDVPVVTDLACRKSDVILAPTDNIVATAINLIAQTALKYRKPLIVSDNILVEFGALAARGVDYKVCGKQAAQITHQVLVDQIKPADIPIQTVASTNCFINQDTLSKLGMTIPSELIGQVQLVVQKEDL